MWPFSQKEQKTPLIEKETQTTVEPPKSFFNSPTFVKAKGVGKIAFGALVLLQPYSAFLIGASVCSAWVLSSTVEAVRDPKNKGTLWEKIKNSAGKEAGVMIGLLAPYVGIGIAAFGGLSYLSNHAEGAQGFFQGGVMATAVGTFGLPILGCAFVAEGLVNTMGYDANFMAKGFSLAKGLYKSATKVLGMAEKNPDNPKEVMKEAHKDVINAKDAITPEAKKLAEHAKNAGKAIASNANEAGVPLPNHNGIMGTVKSFFFREKVAQSRKPSIDDKTRGA